MDQQRFLAELNLQKEHEQLRLRVREFSLRISYWRGRSWFCDFERDSTDKRLISWGLEKTTGSPLASIEGL